MIISRSKHRSMVEVCADCGASDPSWASINRGILLCAECCSVHRSMGRHISHVKSTRQGSWPPSLLAMIQACTAQNVNSIWEHSLLDTSAPKHLRKKPQPKDPLHPTKSEFILAKHLRLAYVLRARRDEPPSELGRQLHSAVRSASLDTAMRLLAQGADPNYFNQEKGTSCLHVACRAGQAAQAELLVAWGAHADTRDLAGNTPAVAASYLKRELTYDGDYCREFLDTFRPHTVAFIRRQGGHMQLCARMLELVSEVTDRLVAHLTGARPAAGAAPARCLVPPPDHDAHEMTDVAKAARGKLQLLPNHLFEELVMDIYDEVDRRETEAVWQTSSAVAGGAARSGVAFLPVNPALSAPRNQGRQKLARLEPAELSALLRDVLADAARRHHMATLQPRVTGPLNPLLSANHLKHFSQMSDDEPLYDSVASDEDYAHLTPIDLEISSSAPRPSDPVSSLSLSIDSPSAERRPLSPAPQSEIELESLKKELHTKDSTINELKNQLKNLQTIVEQLTKENSVLKTNSIDEDSMASQLSMNDSCASNVLDSVKIQERGRSLETDELTRDDAELRAAVKSAQRPVSMFEPREGPKNNWHVTKHQLSPLSGAAGAAGGAVGGAVRARAELVTRVISALWAAARAAAPLHRHVDDLRAAMDHLLDLFTQPSPDASLESAVSSLRAGEAALRAACARPADLQAVRAAAYDLAKATKLLVTHFHPDC